MTEQTDPARALDELDRLAEELGDHLPGLPAVLQVLRAEIASALVSKAKADLTEEAERRARWRDHSSASFGARFGAGPMKAVIAAMDEAEARKPGPAEMEAIRREAFRRRQGHRA